jgi:hypothetical protein
MKEISLHILDLVQNSIRAKATEIEISIAESKANNLLRINIADNGSGMAEEDLNRVTDPFFTSRTTRKVGLGVPLYKQMVEHCNGQLQLTSATGKGTQLESAMDLNHIDRQPMGDIAGVITLLISANPTLRFVYTHQTDHGSYTLDTNELRSFIGNQYDPGIIKYMKEMIIENISEIHSHC